MGYSDIRDVSMFLAGYYAAKNGETNKEEINTLVDCFKYVNKINTIKIPYDEHNVNAKVLKKRICKAVTTV